MVSKKLYMCSLKLVCFQIYSPSQFGLATSEVFTATVLGPLVTTVLDSVALDFPLPGLGVDFVIKKEVLI